LKNIARIVSSILLELNIYIIGISSGYQGQAIILLRQESRFRRDNGSSKYSGNSTHVKTGFLKDEGTYAGFLCTI
jgi:hypothetical protein